MYVIIQMIHKKTTLITTRAVYVNASILQLGMIIVVLVLSLAETGSLIKLWTT